MCPRTAPTSYVSGCFQCVTKGVAVVDTEPEGWISVQYATKRAEEFMNLPPAKSLAFTTYEGDGAVIRAGEIEHIAVMPATKMAKIYEEAIAMAQEAPTHEIGKSTRLNSSH